MDNETKSLIQIKGLRDGLLVSLDDAPWEVQRAALMTQVDAQPAFFQGARLAVDVTSQVLRVNDLVELRDQLSERGISLWAVISESPTTEQTAQLLGLATRVSKQRPEETRQFSVNDLGEETALFLNRTLRSGTRIEFAGHVVVMGDVNPGAEIIAEGNVVIWGRLRGMVHAGVKGDRSAVICALDLSPTQLRIADEVSAVLKPRENPKPEIARINEEGTIAFYKDSAANEPIAVGDLFKGPNATKDLSFDAPKQPGTYYFHCDVHPDQMHGEFKVQ